MDGGELLLDILDGPFLFDHPAQTLDLSPGSGQASPKVLGALALNRGGFHGAPSDPSAATLLETRPRALASLLRITSPKANVHARSATKRYIGNDEESPCGA